MTTSIILRKLSGKLQPLLRTTTGSFGASPGPGAVGAMLFSPLMLLILAIAFAVAWTLSHATGTPDHAMYVMPFAGTLASQLREAEDKIAAKSKTLHEIFEKAGDDIDFGKKDVLDLAGVADSKGVVAKVKELNDELTDLGKKRDEVVQLKQIADDNAKRRGTPTNPVPIADGNDGGGDDQRNGRKRLTLGQVIMGSKAFKEWKRSKSPSMSDEEGFGLENLKAAFLTTAGWAPESLRTGLVVEKATRPIQVLDIVPTGTTDMAAVKYMEETTRTHAGAERAENAAYAESSFALTERSETVRSIGESVPVSDEQLEDVSGSQTYLEQRLMFGCRQRLDGQIVVGDGIAPNLTGIKNKAGIQTQAKGADPAPDAIYKAMVLVRVTGRAFPNAVIMHPNNWQTIRLLRTADGIYIWGSPSEAGPDRIWGIQVVQSDADAAGTAYVGDYANFCALYERKGIEVAVGYVNADFLNGRRTIRAGLRVAFAIYRAAAFATVTGLL